MSFIFKAAQFFRSLTGDDETRALALVDSEATREATILHEQAARAPQEMRALARAPAITLGTSLDIEGRTFSLRLPETEVRGGGHWLVTGATGSGKSYLTLGLIAQLVRRRPSGLVVIDMKGEMAEELRTKILPALVASLPQREAVRLTERVAVIAPFDNAATPPFQVLARDPSLPIELQAHEVASSFGRTIGRDLGVLQSTMLKYAILLAIDAGLSLPDVPQLLQNADFLRGVVDRTRLPEVRAYFAERFPRERASSLASLLSRLDSLLMHPTLRRMLSSRGMIRFDRLLEHAVTVIDLGGRVPAGMRELGRFFGQIIFQKLVRAIFARQVVPGTLPTTIIADEFQEMLSSEICDDFEHFLTLARSQRVLLWLLFQQAAQVERASPTLLRILRTNTNYQVMFRSSLEDARALAHMLPVTGIVPRDRPGFPDPRTPPEMLTPDEERKILVEQVPQMPDRLFWFWNRRRQYGAIPAKSATLSMTDMAARAAALPRELSDLIGRGVLALDPASLDAVISERERRREELAGSAPAVHPQTAAREARNSTETSGRRESRKAERTEVEAEAPITSPSPPVPSPNAEHKPRRPKHGVQLG